MIYYYLNEIKFTNTFLGLVIQLVQGGALEGITPTDNHHDDDQQDDGANLERINKLKMRDSQAGLSSPSTTTSSLPPAQTVQPAGIFRW